MAAAEIYVGLARARAVAVLDAVTDRVVSRISLASLGRRGHPGQISVGPTGTAAVLPLFNGRPDVGLVAGGDRQRGKAAPAGWSARARNTLAGEEADARRCTWVGVGTGRPRPQFGAGGLPEAAQSLTADARGNVYVLVGDAAGLEPTSVAVVDLATGTLRRHLPLATAGESVYALRAQPDGERIYASIWRRDSTPQRWGNPGGEGRLVAIDTRSGQVRAQASLDADTLATDLALAAPPAAPPAGQSGADAGTTGTLAVYAVLTSPGPTQDDDDWWAPPTRSTLVALDRRRLDPLAAWPLDERPYALAMPADGSRAFLLTGPVLGFGWSRRLVSVDLAGSAAGTVSQRWPLPGGCFALAMGPTDKVYVADLLGDRLWRADTRTNTLLGAVPLAGAPIAIAARPA